MFLSDLEAASYGCYGDSVPQADLERFFYLDDAGQALVAGQKVFTGTSGGSPGVQAGEESGAARSVADVLRSWLVSCNSEDGV